MIINDLYTTESTRNCGETTNQYTDELTGNLRLKTGITADAYGLGWIRPENLPSWMRIGELVKTGDYTYTAREITATKNCMCGYMVNSGSSDAVSTVIYNGEYANSSQYTAPVFINQLHPEYYGLYHASGQNFGCQFQYYVYDAGDTLVSSSYLSSNWTPNIFGSVAKFIEFIDDKTSATYNFGSTYGTITITAEDLKTGTCYVETSTGYKVRLFLTGYFLIGNWYRYNGGSTSNMKIDFFAVVHDSDNNEYINTTTTPGFAGINTRIAYASSNNAEPTYSDMSTRFRPACSGTVNTQFITEQNPYTYDGSLLAAYQYGGIAFCPIFTIDDIRRAIALQFRLLIDPNTISYKLGMSYATNVTSADEFTAEWKTGNIGNTQFKNSLRPWQYENFQENDFTEDDVPPYEPEPEPGGDTPGDEPTNLPHDDGTPIADQDSRTLTAPNMFITQYILNYSQLQTIGSNLWQSWLTPNLETWKNFYFAFAQDTGTMDVGAALNFIVSLRAFPFDLAGLTIDYLAASDGVYMGTGHTNFCPGNIAILNTVIGYLDCGTCEVKPETPYNDFRDMYNCSVLCFLPYCGTVELTPAEVIGRTLHVKYHIDFQSGSCTALVKVVGDNGEYTIASKSGQIGFTLPLTATNAGQLSAQFARDATQAAGTLGGFFFDAAKSISENAKSLASAMVGKPNAIEVDSKGNKSLNMFDNNTFDTSMEIGKSGFNTGLSLANQALDMLSRSGIDIPMLSGGSGAESMMQPDTAFIQIRRGKYAKPVNYPHSQGHINGSSNTISFYKGKFTGQPTYPSENNKGLCKFTGIDSTGLTCHDDERAEIIALLESGVYI